MCNCVIMSLIINASFTHLLNTFLDDPDSNSSDVLSHVIANFLIIDPHHYCDYLVSYFIKKYMSHLESYDTCDWPYRKFIILMKNVFWLYKKKNVDTITSFLLSQSHLAQNHYLPKEMVSHISSFMISSKECFNIFVGSFLKNKDIIYNINFWVCLSALQNTIDPVSM